MVSLDHDDMAITAKTITIHKEGTVNISAYIYYLVLKRVLLLCREKW